MVKQNQDLAEYVRKFSSLFFYRTIYIYIRK